MATRLFLTLICGLAAIALGGCASAVAQFDRGPLHGTIVDSETGEPIEGAVVTIIWWKERVGVMHGSDTFLGARETLTDERGRFSISAAPPIVLNPLYSLMDVPKFIAYKPGYYPFPFEKAPSELKAWDGLESRLREGLQIQLVTIPTVAERRAYASFGTNIGGVGITLCGRRRRCIPRDAIPLLANAAEEAARALPKDDER